MHKILPNKLYLVLLVLAAAVIGTAPLPVNHPQPIRVAVDLSEAPRRVFHARLVIPATSGPLTLVYPKWIPGEHAPTGPIADLVGIKFTAGGKPIIWHRDAVDMYAFHCEVPTGVGSLEATLNYLSPSTAEGFSASPAATAQLAVLEWNLVLLYPQGRKSDELTYAASLRLPQGWKFGTALPVAKESAGEIEFQPVSLTTLVDSPVITGAYFRTIPLSPGQTPSHAIDLAGDTAAAVQMSPEVVDRYKRLVAEAGALFGARHYRDYHFLLALSNYVRPFGLEHHESSDNRARERALLDPNEREVFATLLPHEFVHSWNGKYRRPAGLATPDYQQPMRGELLWVYEGLTQYLGNLLAARSGLRSEADYRESLAWTAGYLDHRPGRTWRPLADTAVAAQILYGTRTEWSSWRRGVDFYDESWLIWLEADTIIRRQTQNQRSLDDFCRRFHGGPSGGPAVVPYTFDDVVATMNEIARYDWRGFFGERLSSLNPHAPLGGIEGSGWRLVYTDVPNQHVRAMEETQEITEVSFSLGMSLRHKENDKENGRILEVIREMPAAQAGVSSGMKLISVNGRAWSPEGLRDALREARQGSGPIELDVENAGYYKTYRVDYHGGERYPHLERDSARPDLLERILRPLVASAPAP